ncbi:hypothetical protein GLOTRDRAFT_110955 [Gloeophyllum trabeum ATCC 11539]|uniref:Uncharacterized protein n=1 Tax=Gloeophyllum trabeum (strain ATCC 11539 / FP-39264 / Madison 617) TaxID=670483 RepID=S7RRK8_GLOTA|nr:uncharacterized protein GLOTRDRAFT_110955 [Gloeophyllum trabeum ATCC 11539]EPQ55599.1 hypothetical protein GLOTRDRAFT_110955 [Gloeophyllum trabeum ATCC 11539]
MTSPADHPARGRGRGRGKSRGGLGKYLRARGRGRGRSRPAEFGKRLVLEGEEEEELDPDSEEAKEFARKYSRRELGSNADRYVEPEPELNSDGEVEEEPEVDLSAFLARQRLSPEPDPSSSAPPPPDEEVDESLDYLDTGASSARSKPKKGKAQTIEWDEKLEELSREKAIADASRELKERFKAQSSQQRFRPVVPGGEKDKKKGKEYVEAPPLPIENTNRAKDQKEEMQDFLDDLLG